ncbi:MAG: LamG domain-containing protein [Armatimonadetes bacterium]|nr:LamG domain-containing protein [Armatimonadota bacterium]
MQSGRINCAWNSILRPRTLLLLWLVAIAAPLCPAQTQKEVSFQLWLEQRNQLVKDRDLVAYYDFQEGSGETLRNQAKSNSGLEGVIHGATWDKGRWPGKKALRFDGDDYVEIPDNPSLWTLDRKQGGTGELTVEVSLFPSATGESGIVDKFSEGWGRGTPYALWISSSTVMGCIGDGVAAQLVKDAVALVPDEWVHLVLTIDDSNLSLYKNGLLVNQVGRTIRPADNGKSLLLGTMVPGKFHFKGLIDEVVLFRRALTEKEVNRHFRTKPTVTFFIP